VVRNVGGVKMKAGLKWWWGDECLAGGVEGLGCALGGMGCGCGLCQAGGVYVCYPIL